MGGLWGGEALTRCCNYPLAALFPLVDSPIAPGRTRPTVTPAVTAPASFTGEGGGAWGRDGWGRGGMSWFVLGSETEDMWIVLTSSWGVQVTFAD